MSQITIPVGAGDQLANVFGAFDANIKAVETQFGVAVYNRSGENGNALVVDGPEDGVNAAASVLRQIMKKAQDGPVDEQTVSYLCHMTADGEETDLASFDRDCICVTVRGKPIKAKTLGQKKYVDLIAKNTIVLGVGPAGTGKTFLAVAMAVKALREKQVNRIILTRPAIEAGERLGFLPGDLQSKIDPYLRPLYDALYEMMGAENYQRHVEKGTIEIAPLAYMRGRTLDDSFIILDEAQNATPEQMKMFLTRLGAGSRAVVTGDLTQTDLPGGIKSGLSQAVKILDGIDDIAIHHFSERDVVRHKLVQKIILAYEKYDRRNAEKEPARHAERTATYTYHKKGSGTT